MALIKFGIDGEKGLLCIRKIENGGEKATIEIDGVMQGIVALGEKKLMLKAGAVSLKLSDICDGYTSPMLISEGKIMRGEGFVKSENTLYTAENALCERAALDKRIRDLEASLKAAESEISRLNKAAKDGYTFTLI